eukprot:CAMPEP_0116119798 /NCGR_PEP_ID=MMETSP0329-20121206/2836_1 /TAXON_ID=697910 /ORGANISM="Pseudo-nitzschia arenysensis, Strain B593" /LENGTH=1489 /DNA_ID=CAMNT_0003613529 /DNA_START=106 /DNA_END=4575 /DNA_ORIENTATION=+
MVVKTLQEMKGKDRGHKMSHQELISQRRKTNSPTIEEEEPFDEPKSTPRAETKIIIGTRPKNSSSRSDRVNAEIDMLSWTGSELDDGDGKKCHRGAKDKSKSIHSLVWSESELDDTRDNNVNERDDFNETRGKAESRDGKTESDANMRTVSAQNRSALEEHKQKTIYKKQQSKSTVQFCMENDNKNSNKEKVLKSKKSSAQPENNKVREATKKKEYDNMAIRTERSTDSGIAEDESNVYDGISAFSITPSVAPSVTASVTRRTRNTRNPKSPRTPRTARRTSFGDTETTTGEASVLTAEVVEKMNDRCSMMPGKKKQNRSATKKGQSKSVGEEDLLDRFFDNIESRVCKTPRRRENEKDGLKRLINPFLVRLEQFDCIFEHLEEIACPEEDEADDDSRKTRPSTPAAFAAATFSQLLDQIEKFDPVFAKVKATSCQTNCDIYGGNDMEEGCCDSVDEDMSKVSVQENEEPNNNSPYEVLEKAYERAEQMVKDQKQTSCDEKDQLQKMKEQWYEAKSNWKLRQSILLEAVRLNTAKAAETTTKYMETIVSSCHPSMSSEMMGDENHKKNEDGKVPRHFSIKESSKDLDSVSDASEVYRDASEVYHDAASIDNSDFSSMMSPSEHSNINSKHVAFRSNLLSPSEHSNIHSSRRTSRSVAFDDLNEEASYTEDNPEASVGISNSPLAVIKEEVAGAESTTSESSSNRKSKGAKASVSPKTIRRWAYPAPAYYNEKSNNGRESEMPPTNPKEWINMWKDTVDSVSGKILDRAQCASASINLADSNSFEDDTEKNRTGMKQQNSIIEYEENSVSIIAGGESVDNDDLSGFESAVNTMDFEQDERPPMLRLMKSRTDSRSCGSRGGSHDEVECTKSNSKSGSVRSRLSTDTPESYTLAESIRNSSLSDQNNEANATRVMKEPRGNKVKTDPSSHIRGGSVPTPAPQKPDPESKQKDRERIRSPKSSETNETSDMTAVSASSSDVVVTQMADSTHLIIPMVVGEEKSEGKESTDDLESTENSPVNTPTAVADDDADKATVFSYNTTSTGSTEFKDCYQDAIPSMSTMGTVLEDEMPTVSAQKKNQRGESLKNIRGTSFLASDANIVKSVALLSVSATVLKSAQNTTSAFNDSELFEMESVPSTSSYTQEEAVLASISEETDISDEESLINQETDQSPCTLLVDNSIVKASVTEESIKNSSKEGGPNRILGTLHEAIDLEETAMEDTDGNPNKLHHEDNRVEEELKDRKLRREECFPKHQMSKMDISEPMRKYDSNDQSTPFKGIPSIEKMNINKHLRTAFEQATVDSKINPDDLILESLQQQESVQKQERIRLNSHQFQETMQPENMLVEQSSIDEPMTDLKPKHQYEELTMSDSSKPLYGLVGNEDEVKSNSASTSRTKKISSKLREPRSVEDRRRRRLRQRRKFEKILRGEDDSSTMSSSTMSGGGSHHDSKLQNEEQGDKKSNNGQAGAPLISASFDTGFGSAPVIEESQQYY